MRSQFINGLFVGGGTFFLVVGIIGIVLPLLPTTPFFLLATACYMRGSKKIYNWFIHNRLIGNYIQCYQEERSLPINGKIFSIIFLWVTILCSILFILSNSYIELFLIIIAVIVTVHILTIKTMRADYKKKRIALNKQRRDTKNNLLD